MSSVHRSWTAGDAVLRLFALVDRRAWDQLHEVFAPDVVYHRPGYAPFVGLEAVVTFYRDVRVIALGEHKLERVVANSTTGACWGRFVGQRKDGGSVDELFADAYEFVDLRIARRQSFFFRPAT